MSRSLESPVDVPQGQSPLLLAAEPGDLLQGIFLFERLDPEAGEARLDQLLKSLG
jgi:hypothetical protein